MSSCLLVPVHDMWRLTDPDYFFDLSESLINLPVNYFCPIKRRERTLKGKKNLRSDKDKSKGCVVIPYIKGLSESIAWVMKDTACQYLCDQITRWGNSLVRPQDKLEKENTCGVVYDIPYHKCDLKCKIGETGRKFNTRLRDYQNDVKKNVPQIYTRSEWK